MGHQIDEENDGETAPTCSPEATLRSFPDHPGKLGVFFICEKCGAVGETAYGGGTQIDVLAENGERPLPRQVPPAPNSAPDAAA